VPRRGCKAPSTIRVRETAFAPNHRELWTESEVMKIMADNTHDDELAEQLGRSINAIRQKRFKVNKEQNK